MLKSTNINKKYIYTYGIKNVFIQEIKQNKNHILIVYNLRIRLRSTLNVLQFPEQES